MTGTLGSLEFMTELITDKSVTGNEADIWLTTLTFIKNPTKEMIQAVKVSYKKTKSKKIKRHTYALSDVEFIMFMDLFKKKRSSAFRQ